MSPAPPLQKCPICKSPTDAAYRPFCSRRCADVDLGRWLTGGYVIAGSPDEDQDTADQAQASARNADQE